MGIADHDRASPPVDGVGVPASALDRVPLPIRGVLYYLAFLGAMLIVLPVGVVKVEELLGQSVVFPLPVRVIGAVVACGFLIAYTVCSFHLMSRGAGAYVEFDPPKHFVASGPFRWCRNPIAACVVGMILGEALAVSSILLLVLFLIAVPIAHVQVVFVEEPLLAKRFGSTYEEYRRTVPRWIPRRPRDSAS